MIKRILIILFLLSGTAYATDRTVGSGGDFDPVSYSNDIANAIEAAFAASSGDDNVIILNAESPIDVSTITAIDIDDDGTSGHQITIKPETLGGVTFSGDIAGAGGHIFTITGDYITISGFKFLNITNAGSPDCEPIATDNNTGTIIEHCLFDTINGTEADNCWIIWAGHDYASTNLIVRYCEFDTINGIPIVVDAKSSIDGSASTGAYIHHNKFHDDIGLSGTDETIFMGDDSGLDVDMNAIVEYNYFYNLSGDTETVSNKSSSNIYRYNVFSNTYSLTLRGGDDCLVDSNYFYGCGGPSGTSRVIRIWGGTSGHGHKVINNYFENCTGDSTIYIPGADSAHDKVVDLLVANNTILFSYTYGIWIGYVASPIADPYPENITIENNAIWNTRGYCVACNAYDPSGPPTYTTNVAYSDGTSSLWKNNGCAAPGSGFTDTDPGLTDIGAMYEPSASSAVYENGTPDASVTADIVGGTRDGSTPDIGCREVGETASIVYSDIVNGAGYVWLPSLSVEATDSTATEEGTTTGEFTITCSGDGCDGLSVAYTLSGAANYTSDYTVDDPSPTSISGTTSVITVTPVDDGDDDDADNTVILTIDPSANYDITIASDTVYIIDNDDPPAGSGTITLGGSGTITIGSGGTITIAE